MLSSINAETSSYMSSVLNVWSSNGWFSPRYEGDNLIDNVYGKAWAFSKRFSLNTAEYMGIDLG